MTRALSHSAAATLLKNKFAALGAVLPHQEALDTVAQLQGYQAWSHLKAAERKASKGKKPPAARAPKGVSFSELVQYHSGSDFEGFPRADWAYQVSNEDTTLGYLEWVKQSLAMHHDLVVDGVVFEPAPTVPVIGLDGSSTVWNIEENLTDRWGDLNLFGLERKAGLPLLLLQDASVLEQLRSLMVGEETFIVRKDGRFGLLFEVEYCSLESDGSGPAERAPYPQEAELLKRLRYWLAKMAPDYPGVDFCVPEMSVVSTGRPSVWGFVPLDRAAQTPGQQLAAMQAAMDSLDRPVPAHTEGMLNSLQ